MYTSKYVVFNDKTKRCQFLKSNEICEQNGELLGITGDYGDIVAELDASYFSIVKNLCKKSIVEFKRNVLEALTIDVNACILNTEKSVYKALLHSYGIVS